MGSLKDFIVPDDVDMADSAAEEDDDDAPDEVAVEEEDQQNLELMAAEAARITGGLSGTVVGGRTLRSREPAAVAARTTRDTYYERFGRADEAKLMEKFTKKDIIEFVGTLKSEYKESYEAAGNVWPVLTTRMSLDAIRSEYDKIKKFADLPDSDDEESSSASSGDDDDSEASDDDEESSDDASDEDASDDD